MEDTLLEQKAEKIASFKGIDVYKIKSDKFKTNSINFFFQDNLSRENVTKNALFPAVIRRGCKNYPAYRDLALRLEELYGTVFDCGVTKKGERHIIQFYTEFIPDKYIPGDSNQFNDAFDLLFQIITDPVLEKGAFKQDYLAQEKDNLKRLIEGRVNDKMHYSLEKCLEEMCRDEPYGIYDYGFVSDLKNINGSDLYAHYRNVLETCPLQVYFSGNIDEAKLKDAVARLSEMDRGATRELAANIYGGKQREVSNITDRMNVTQGKLTLGFWTETSPKSPDYYPLMVYNGILGGGMHSKLFQNVREKASLAYYAFSRLEKFRGLMAVSCGIEIENRDRAVEIISEQLNEIKKGNISDYEFDSTIKTIETGINSLKDNQMNIVDFYLSQTVAGTADSFEDLIKKIKNVSKKDVVEIANRIKLDTIYFLTAVNES